MRCYHCTETVLEPERWQVFYDGGERDVCCIGCQAVMQAIVDSDLGDYYRFRTEPALFGVVPENISAKINELAVFDEPEISERFLQSRDDDNGSNLVEVNLSVEGLRCGACVWVLERSVTGMQGVDSASVNFSSARATVSFNPKVVKLSGILARIAQVGYRTVPFDVRERELSLKKESRVFMQRLFIAGIAMMQVMMYALPAYITDAGDIDPEFEQLFRWASLVLTTPVLLYSAQPFLKGAWIGLLNRRPGMDMPVSIGILAAFSASVWATLNASGEIYFDSVAMFVFLLLGARYLEWSVRRRAMRAVDDISSAAPETAQRINKDNMDEVEVVPALRLEVGEQLIVDNGARIPVDGIVLEGNSAVNNALVTGESVPVTIAPGDTVAGGALLMGAPVRLEVLRRQSASTLSVIDKLIDRGASEKPKTVQTADRIATVFVTLLLLFAIVVYLVWMLIDPSRAASTAIAVLVVSCPCALSLATPATLAAATGDLLTRRLLITRGHALEALSRVTDVVFDKTGTLTQGKPILTSMSVVPDFDELTMLEVAVAMEIGSTHPHASALREACRSRRQKDVVKDTGEVVYAGHRVAEQGGASSNWNRKDQNIDEAYEDCVKSPDEASDPGDALNALGYRNARLHHEAGSGVSAELENGDTLYLGSAMWCSLDESLIGYWRGRDSPEFKSASEVFLSIKHASGKVDFLARFLLQDSMRSEAHTLVETLHKRGLQVHLLSGDRQNAVMAAADELGIAAYRSDATPEGKQRYVSALQDQNKIVLMVGDGINDAPVLATANVSMAAGEATALARTAADVISLSPGLEGLPLLLSKAQHTSQIVRQNLIWASSYNVLAIPAAALGYVPPWAAAVGMALSSLLVAANAQRSWTKTSKVTSVPDTVVSHI